MGNVLHTHTEHEASTLFVDGTFAVAADDGESLTRQVEMAAVFVSTRDVASSRVDNLPIAVEIFSLESSAAKLAVIAVKVKLVRTITV